MLRQRRARMLDPLDQSGRGRAAELFGVLLPGRQPGADHPREVDAVVAGGGNILRDAQARLGNGVEPAEIGVVVGEEDAARALRQRQQLFHRLAAAQRLVILAGEHVFLRHLEPQLLTGAVKARQTPFRHRGGIAVDIGDAAVAHAINMADQFFDPVQIVREDRHAVVKSVVERDHRDVGKDQLAHRAVKEVGADDRHALDAAGARMLQIAALLSRIAVDEGDVIAAALGLVAEAVEHRGEVLVHEAAVLEVRKQDAEIVGAVGLERAGDRIGRISHLPRRAQHAFARRLADILLAVEGLAHGGHGNAASAGYVLHGNHRCRLLNRLRKLKYRIIAKKASNPAEIIPALLIFVRRAQIQRQKMVIMPKDQGPPAP